MAVLIGWTFEQAENHSLGQLKMAEAAQERNERRRAYLELQVMCAAFGGGAKELGMELRKE